MKKSKAFDKLTKEVNEYLYSLKYEELVKHRDLYAKVHDDLSRILVNTYSDSEPLSCIDIGVRRAIDKVEISGFIKVDIGSKITFLNIDMTYKMKV